MAFKAVNNYGMDAELAEKMLSKYDKALEEKVQVWIETVTGITFTKEFGPMLQDGIVLCELVNAILPGRIKKINEAGGLFKMQENITSFLRVCREIGVAEASLFPTESLAQLKDLNQVLVTINAFSNTVQLRLDELGSTYDGPFLGISNSKTMKKFGTMKSSKSEKGTNTMKKKWVVKPGGSSAVSMLNQGSSGTMEQTKYVDAREQIKRNQLDGKGKSNEISTWNKGSQGVMEESKYVDAREQIKRNQLDGKGKSNEISQMNKGSQGIMEETKYVDAREEIKRGQL